TALTAYDSTNGTSRIFYWTNPTVGSGHTFTFGGNTSAVCIEAWSNMATASVFDSGTDAGNNAASGTTCAAGSITPSSGVKVVIATSAFNQDFTSIDSSFTASANISLAGGSNYGDFIAHLLQTPNGASTNPTSTVSISSKSCAI